jgi:hypothetical protein
MKRTSPSLQIIKPAFALALTGIIVCGLSAVPARATSFEIGLGNFSNVFPFSSSSPQYVGEYQQIYSSTAFSGPLLISSMAFETGTGNGVISASYDFTLSLGETTRTPSSPGSAYSGTFIPVFSGPLTVNYTSAGAFDFVVNFATPFAYDPSLGNLLMDIVINSPSSASAIFAASTGDPNMGRVFNSGGNGPATAGPGQGLDTLFTGSASSVPDSSNSAFLLGLGIVGLFSVRRVIGLQQRV